jgi:hypothetical protein
MGRERRIWHRWVQIVVRDSAGRLVAARDGAVIVDEQITLFYASHIVTDGRRRSRGIGGWLAAVALQAADDHLADAARALGITIPGDGSASPRLRHEICEVEFPDPTPAGAGSLLRLPFHGRLGRAALWPLRYAQPDTNYQEDHFDPLRWNSVPMFLCHRSFPQRRGGGTGEATRAVALLYDYFSRGRVEGVESDRAHYLAGLKTDGPLRAVPLPTSAAGIPAFIRRTGTLQDLLPRYYPNHRYTRDRLGPLAPREL